MPEDASRDSILERLSAAARAGQRIVYALGTFRLIHAGTVRYLRGARRGSDALYAVALPLGDPVGSGGEETLLKPSERCRVLAMLREVDGAVLADSSGGLSLEDLHAAAPDAAWTRCEPENDVDGAALRRLETLGVAVRSLEGEGVCTTGEILARIAR